MPSPSPPSLSGAPSKPVIRSRYFFIPPPRDHRFVTFVSKACPRHRAPLPRFPRSSRHFVPPRRQASPHIPHHLCLWRLHRPHWRPRRRQDAHVVIARHDYPSAPHDGRRDRALEERAGERRLVARCARVVQREHVRLLGADQREHGITGYHG